MFLSTVGHQWNGSKCSQLTFGGEGVMIYSSADVYGVNILTQAGERWFHHNLSSYLSLCLPSDEQDDAIAGLGGREEKK